MTSKIFNRPRTLKVSSFTRRTSSEEIISDEQFSVDLPIKSIPKGRVHGSNHFKELGLDNFEYRINYREKYGFTIVTRELAETLSAVILSVTQTNSLDAHAPVIEIGAGLGTLTKALNLVGTKTIGYDKFTFNNRYFGSLPKKIRDGDIYKAMKEHHQSRIFVMSWPNHSTPFAHDVAQVIPKGSILFYLGEVKGGCTADDNFFNYVEAAFKPHPQHEKTLGRAHLSWAGVHDTWSVVEKIVD